jgi:cysteinyl-tRNA synthetase
MVIGMLKIYNSLTKQKEVFKPIEEGKIGLYVCGATVYDYCHIGHARSIMINPDMIVRYLRYRGYEVTYIRNITDVDDKIIARANKNNESCDTLTQRFIDAMHIDEQQLGVIAPDHEPRATQTIDKMIAMIQTLIDKQFAYIGENGDVFFEVARFSEYGKLSHQNIDQLKAGERIEVEQAKRDPLDFVLWKLAKPDEPSWSSPWGEGRPGWHIECSAMSTSMLGNNFDIHGGGLDLKFPHHENEIAQSECATGCQFANYWMHAGLLQVDGEKMSKSLGNFFTARDILAKYPAEVVRYFMLSSHYRSPLNYCEGNMANAKASLDRFYTALRGLPETSALANSEYQQKFISAMDDDFNTPIALAVLFDLVRDINKIRQQDLEHAAQLAATLRELGSVLGLLQQQPEQFLQGEADNTADIEQLIAQRNQALAEKNWTESDRIRDQLAAMGIVIEDSVNGTSWKRV